MSDFEIPEYYNIAIDKDILLSLSIAEYNIYINLGDKEARQFKLKCFKRHLKDNAMTTPKEIKSCYYDINTKSIIAKEGYIFNPRTCIFERVTK